MADHWPKSQISASRTDYFTESQLPDDDLKALNFIDSIHHKVHLTVLEAYADGNKSTSFLREYT